MSFLILLVKHVGASNEEVSAVLGHLAEFFLGAIESHLLVIWRGKDVLGLGLLSQLTREDLALNIRVRANIRDGQCDAFTHNLRIEVVTFYLFLLVA